MEGASGEPRRRPSPPRPGDHANPWGLLLVGAIFVAALFAALQVNDLAYQIRVGESMLATHQVPRSDFLTYTIPGAPWIDQQWGAQLIFASLARLGGWRALSIIHASMLAGLYGAAYRIGRSNGASPIVAAVASIAGYVVAALVPGSLALRPQLLVVPLFLLSWCLIDRRDVQPHRLLWLLPIGVVWANLHGSFPLLTLLIAIAAADDLIRRRPMRAVTTALFAVSALTPFISPFGANTYRYVWNLLTSDEVRSLISEWGPLWGFAPAALAMIAALASGAVAVRRMGTRALRGDEVATLIALTALVVWSARNVTWWSVVAPAIFSTWLAGWDPGMMWTRRVHRFIAAGVATTGALAIAATLARPLDDLLTEAPQGVTAALAQTPSSDRIFNESWGSWFEYAFPDRPMFSDARVELFPPAIWNDYFAIVDGEPGWHDAAKRWGITIIVVNGDHQVTLTAALDRDRCWALLYRDAEGAIYHQRASCM
jgi:hypothetical protein